MLLRKSRVEKGLGGFLVWGAWGAGGQVSVGSSRTAGQENGKKKNVSMRQHTAERELKRDVDLIRFRGKTETITILLLGVMGLA